MKNHLQKIKQKGKSGLKTIFRSLKYKNFRLFFAGQSLSLIGTWIQRIAMPWLVYSLTDSVFLLGIVGFVTQIPTFILGPFAGVLVDRHNKYRILVLTQVLSMLQALILAVLYFTHSIQIWHVIVLGIFLGIINAFDTPARQSFFVDMIDKKEDLSNAIALNSAMVNGARLVGPTIAGILISLTNEGICFLLNGLSYVFVIASLLFMVIRPSENKKKNKKIGHEIAEGFKYSFGFAPIRDIIILLALMSLVGMPYTVLLPVFATKILHGGPHTFGFLMAGAGAGALAGALYMASRKKVNGLEKLMPVFSAIFGIGLVAFSFSTSFLLSLLIVIFIGIGMMIQMSTGNIILQTIVDDDKRGRVMSFYSMAFMGIAPFGSLLAGSLAKSIGPQRTLLYGGVLCVIGAIWFASNLPNLQKLMNPIYLKLGLIKNEMPQNLQP